MIYCCCCCCCCCCGGGGGAAERAGFVTVDRFWGQIIFSGSEGEFSPSACEVMGQTLAGAYLPPKTIHCNKTVKGAQHHT